MSDFTADDWLLLHDVRLRGLVEPPVGTDIDRFVEAGVLLAKGRFVALSPEGRSLHARWALVIDHSDAQATASRFYEGFHELNRELLAVCSAWQVTPAGVTNDHRDAAYDWEVISRLERLHERAAPRIRRVARDVDRFGSYAVRLQYALRQVVDEASLEWFTSPRVDSYHTVWNQLHEDLLLALGLDRADEPSN